MIETAYAKVNLALHLRARMADGYHRIETLFAFAEDGDSLEAGPGEGLSLALRGPFARALEAAGDNLVLKAAHALRARFDVDRGAALTLDKRLPVASGIGGGSADAAAALRLLARWWGLDAPPPALLDIARSLGADVPACLASATARGEGRGDLIAPAPSLAGTFILLVNPGIELATGEVFARWDGVDRGPLGETGAGRNDLEGPAIAIAPVIAEVLAILHSQVDVGFARMSGSGATCFALFESEAARDRASRRIARVRPGWWRLASRLR